MQTTTYPSLLINLAMPHSSSATDGFIRMLPITNVTHEECDQYEHPLPDGFIATKEDEAKDMFEVKRLADKFGYPL
jgi:hypothetical protein